MNLGEIGIIDELKFNWWCVYAHGELQTFMGDDRISFNISQSEVPDGVHTAKKGSEKSVIVFLWSGSSIWNSKRGLCVFSDDVEGRKYAETKYKEKAKYL